MNKNINVMYLFGDIKNPVNDGMLESIQNSVYKLTDIDKKIEILKQESKNISNEIDRYINAAREHGYTNKEISDTIGTLYIA